MLLKEMNVKVASDLNIPLRRARAMIDVFHLSYKGRLEAITEISASYNDNGEVEIKYIINNKENRFTIGGGPLYANKKNKRTTSKKTTQNS